MRMKSGLQLDRRVHNVDNEIGLSWFDDRSIDFFMIDGPYFITDKEQWTHKSNTKVVSFGEWDFAENISMMKDILVEVERTMASNGSAILWSGWEALPILARYVEEVGLQVKRKLVWVKPSGNPLLAGIGPLHLTEEAIWIGRSKPFYQSGISAKNWFECPSYHGPDRFHPCEKPLKLYREIASRFVREGSATVELFAGSAPMMQVAREYGCDYAGFELDPLYARLANERRGLK